MWWWGGCGEEESEVGVEHVVYVSLLGYPGRECLGRVLTGQRGGKRGIAVPPAFPVLPVNLPIFWTSVQTFSSNQLHKLEIRVIVKDAFL